ncbi:MAG TPA: hypothetical protein VED46_08990 [Alphaproteobacteria bacterium]|nr:hypothetical protein [Alphaproteobacteria bacterium]
MRIAFLCGGLGLGGVADYTRLIADQLASHDCESLIIALADRQASAILKGGAPPVQTLALPEGIGWPRRVAAAEEALAAFAPDWISLQFVPFAFNRKGVVWLEERWLLRLLCGRPLHLMAHELWIEPLPRPVPIRRRILRGAQRHCILRLFRRAAPCILHTSNALYRRLLAEADLSAQLLPLFGNVPIAAQPDRAWLDGAMAQGGIGLARKPLLFGFFGGVDPEWDAYPLLARLSETLGRLGRPGVVLSAGAAGGIAGRMEEWRRRFPTLGFLALGVQPMERLSAYLQALDFGLTSYPYALIAKSSSVISMLEHGLPVIVSWGDLVPDLPAIEPELNQLLLRPGGDIERFLATPPNRSIRGSAVPGIAEAMLRDLDREPRRQKEG